MFDNMNYSEFTDYLFSMKSLNNLGYSLATTIFSYRESTREMLAEYVEKLNTALANGNFYAVPDLSTQVIKLQTDLNTYNELLRNIKTFKSVTEKEEG